MEYLYNRLPKDLVYIIEDYAKDTTNYDNMLRELTLSIDSWISDALIIHHILGPDPEFNFKWFFCS